MTRYFIFIIVALSATSIFSGCITNVSDETIEKVSVQDAKSFTALKVSRSSDDVTVTGWSSDTISATASLSIWANSSDKATQIGQDLQFSWATTSTTAELLVTSDKSDQELAHLREMEIRAPSRFGLTLETSSGDIKAMNMIGDLDLTTSSGTVTAATVGRVIVNSSSGDVNAVCGRGASLDLSSGDVSLDVTSIDFEGITVSTSSGDVALRLADSARVTFDLSTSAGDISVNYSGTSTSTSDGDLRLDVNGGGKIVHLETSSGDIRVMSLH